MKSKKFFESKLNWVGIVQFLVGVFTFIQGWLEAGDFSPFGIFALISGVVTIILRTWFTDSSIE